jgi:hypothetical protein
MELKRGNKLKERKERENDSRREENVRLKQNRKL